MIAAAAAAAAAAMDEAIIVNRPPDCSLQCIHTAIAATPEVL